MPSLDLSGQKRVAAQAAVDYVESEMVVGLGSGSTAEIAFSLLAERIAAGLRITGVPSSQRTAEIAASFGIPLVEHPEEVIRTDLYIDGADEATEDLYLLKGGGGALTREKIIASVSETVIIIVDSSKLKQTLGAFPLAVEVLPFGHKAAAEAVRELGARDVVLRASGDERYLTDNGNYILDCHFGEISDPETLTRELNGIPAVVENGIFEAHCDLLIIGRADGETDEYVHQVGKLKDS